MFKKDDKVFNMRYGWGTVKEIRQEKDDIYPVVVEFLDEAIITFTKNGEEYENGVRNLYFAEPKYENYEEMITRPMWKPKEREMYYFINSMGEIDDTNFMNNNECDTSRLKYGNFFKTEDEAKESKFYKVFHEEE